MQNFQELIEASALAQNLMAEQSGALFSKEEGLVDPEEKQLDVDYGKLADKLQSCATTEKIKAYNRKKVTKLLRLIFKNVIHSTTESLSRLNFIFSYMPLWKISESWQKADYHWTSIQIYLTPEMMRKKLKWKKKNW